MCYTDTSSFASYVLTILSYLLIRYPIAFILYLWTRCVATSNITFHYERPSPLNITPTLDGETWHPKKYQLTRRRNYYGGIPHSVNTITGIFGRHLDGIGRPPWIFIFPEICNSCGPTPLSLTSLPGFRRRRRE